MRSPNNLYLWSFREMEEHKKGGSEIVWEQDPIARTYCFLQGRPLPYQLTFPGLIWDLINPPDMFLDAYWSTPLGDAQLKFQSLVTEQFARKILWPSFRLENISRYLSWGSLRLAALYNVVALDPGLSGAIAILHNTNITAYPLPIAGKTLDLAALTDIIRDAAPQLAVIEKVASMPGQGVASTFKFGQGYGALLGITAALGIPTELVTPQRWKGSVLAGTSKDKDAAIAYCRRTFPNVQLVMPGCRKPHDGVADALCLLQFGIRAFLREAA
jgi:crossover junction endodeoxyribonuclease RuvC